MCIFFTFFIVFFKTVFNVPIIMVYLFFILSEVEYISYLPSAVTGNPGVFQGELWL